MFTLPADAVVPVPDDVPPPRAVLAANMETALNAVWDGAPGPADRIAVVGGGLVGLLVAYLCARLPGARGDGGRHRTRRAPSSRARSARASRRPTPRRPIAISSSTPAPAPPASRPRCGSPARRRRIVELSWYGSGDVAAPLGEAFHSRRLRLVSSQVGKVAPSHRPRWSHGRRLAAALALLDDPALDALLAPAVAFDELPAQLAAIFGSDSDARLPADPLSRPKHPDTEESPCTQSKSPTRS